MRVFALGGYGKVGFPAVRLLAQSDLVSEIAIAGRKMEQAEKAASDIGQRAVAIQADGTDGEELAALLAGYDLLMNAAYDRTVQPAIGAAIRTGTHYCDPNVVNDQTFQLAAEAAAAGISAIVANGISPCISNLMGVYAAGQLDQVEQIQTGRADLFDLQTGGELTPAHWLEGPMAGLAALQRFKPLPFIRWMLGRLQKGGIPKVVDHHEGQWVAVEPMRSGLEVPLVGGNSTSLHAYFCGNDYWGMLPRDLAAVPPVEIWFSQFPPLLGALIREQALHVLEDGLEPEAAVKALYDAVEEDPAHWLTVREGLDPISKLWVRAVGDKDGRTARFSCWFTAPMWDVGGYYLTSVALAVAARKVLRGEVRERGIMTAEKAFEPLPFLDEVVSLLPDSLPAGRMIDESFEWLE